MCTCQGLCLSQHAMGQTSPPPVDKHSRLNNQKLRNQSENRVQTRYGVGTERVGVGGINMVCNAF